MCIEKKNIIAIFILVAIPYCNLKTQTPVMLPGFPKIITGVNPIFAGASPIVCNIDNQGENEIFFLANGPFGSTNIYILNSDGQFLKNWPITIFSSSFPSHAAGDINHDGFIDIVIRTKDTIFVYDYNGNILQGFPVYFKSDKLPQLALYDLDNDGTLEIITTGDNLVSIYNSNGIIRNGWPRRLPGIPDKVFTSPISVGDLNNDNIPEIILSSSYCEDLTPCDSNQTNIFEPDGNTFPNWPVQSDSNYVFFSQAASIFKDNAKDSTYILVNSAYYYYPNLDSTRTRTSIYNSEGIILNRFYTTSYFLESSSIALGNVDSEISPELSFGGESRPVYLTSSNGKVFNNWPVMTNGYYYRAPLIGRLSNSNINILSFVSYRDMSGNGFIYSFNPDGSQTSWSPLRPIGIPMAIMTICDLNNDKQTDLISISFGSSNNVDSTIVTAWTFHGLIYNRNDNPWPMYGHDRYRTFQYGFIPPDEPVGIHPINTIIPTEHKLYQNFPNPFNPSTEIQFDITHSETSNLNFRLIVYDVLGREVAILLDQNLMPGQYRVLFDASRYSSGIYFYNLYNGDTRIDSKKMLLIK